MRGVVAAALVAIVLVGAYAALGGGRFEPHDPPDPCKARAVDGGSGLTGTLQRIGLEALSGTACQLGVSRERLVLSLSGRTRIGVSDKRRTAAFRAGLLRALDAEERAGRIAGTQAFLVRQAIQVLPVDAILQSVFGGGF